MAKNNKPGSIKLPEKALLIIQTYQNRRTSLEDEEYIFPDLKEFALANDKVALHNQIHYRLSKIDNALKPIGEKLGFTIKLTMHIARHSFATISGSKIPVQILQQLYRHSDINVTVEYMKAFVTDGTDKPLEKVLDY